MDAEFWRERWREGRLGWHHPAAHPMLVRRLPEFGLAEGARVFLPLCGKTLDVGWLLSTGFRVAGAELVETAVEQLFAGLGVEPRIEPAGPLSRYSAPGVDIFVGDIFDLNPATLGPVDLVYDRAALVALPEPIRRRYAAHVTALAAGAPQLLVTFDYDQSRMDGPPFSVTEAEVRALYGSAYDVAPVDSAEVEGGLKGFCPAMERAWALKARR
ncbi:MAG: thiopurine S-methyltransferase [Hansschlegelia sp.]